MGLAEVLFGAQSPIAQWAGQNQNFLGAVGAGLGQGQNIQSGLSAGLAAVPGAKALDREHAEKLKAEAKIEAQTNATQAWLEQNHPDLAQMVGAGMPVSEAWNAAMERMRPASSDPIRGIEIDGKLVNPVTGELMGDFSSPGPMKPISVGAGETLLDPNTFQPVYTGAPKALDAPTGYRYGQNGNLEYIPGGPADPSTPGKTTEAQRRNQQLSKVIQPELAIVEKNWGALSDVGNQASGSNQLTYSMSSPEFQQAKNSLRTIIASYLYSVSGATATPQEIDNQANILTPQPFESAQAVANKLDRIRTMVRAVVDAGQGDAVAGNQTATGVQWSLEP